MTREVRKTLLDHRAAVHGTKGHGKYPPIEVALEFAARRLKSLGVSVTERAAIVAALEARGDAYQVAWLQRHAAAAGSILVKAPPASRGALREMWMHAFLAGEAHAGIEADHQHLRAVQGQERRSKTLAERARPKSADKRRKFPDSKLRAMIAAGYTQKAMARALGVRRQTIYNRTRALKR